MHAMPLAPAGFHNLASSLISENSLGSVFSWDWKILAFRSFQRDQQMRTARDRAPLYFADPAAPATLWNQSATPQLGVQCKGSKEGRDAQRLTSVQTLRENGHSRIRCSKVSRLRQRKGQKYSFSHSQASNRSAVHTLFWRMNHRKTLHRISAHTCQTVAGREDSTPPSNCIRYADLAE
jgi:hypothetical protein